VAQRPQLEQVSDVLVALDEATSERTFDGSETDAPTSAQDAAGARAATRYPAYGERAAPVMFGGGGPSVVAEPWSVQLEPGGMATGTPSPMSYGQPTPLPPPGMLSSTGMVFDSVARGHVAAFQPRRRYGLLAVLSGVVALALAVLVVSALRGRDDERAAAGPTAEGAGSPAAGTATDGAPAAEAAAAAATAPVVAPLEAIPPDAGPVAPGIGADARPPAVANPAAKVAATPVGNRPLRRPPRPPRERAQRRPPAAPLAPIEMRFKSRPTAELYAVGSGSSLCATPCKLTIDPEDGGARNRRTFVLRRKGYSDEVIRVDLTKPPKDVNVTLTRVKDEDEGEDGATYNPFGADR
jgi:hypothetical protein